MKRSFSVNWDYRCPFARNAHEHLLAGLEAGADWDVQFLVFSLEQSHVVEGGTPVWEEPDRTRVSSPTWPAWWFVTVNPRHSERCTPRCSRPAMIRPWTSETEPW